MNVRPALTQCSASELDVLRDAYLSELPYCQDALLESFVSRATFHQISQRDEVLGYVALLEGRSLVEFHVLHRWSHLGFSLFRATCSALKPRDAIVKTFDAQLLSYSLDLSRRVEVMGMLVREFVPEPLPSIARISYQMRPANACDLPRVLAVDQQVFTVPERLAQVIARGEMLLFERDPHLIGFGLVRPIIDGRPDREVGIAVDAPFRNKGYAPYILRDLAQYCLDHGYRPASGAAIDNEASIRIGQRIGFRALHRLVKIHF